MERSTRVDFALGEAWESEGAKERDLSQRLPCCQMLLGTIGKWRPPTAATCTTWLRCPRTPSTATRGNRTRQLLCNKHPQHSQSYILLPNPHLSIRGFFIACVLFASHLSSSVRRIRNVALRSQCPSDNWEYCITLLSDFFFHENTHKRVVELLQDIHGFPTHKKKSVLFLTKAIT